METTSKMPNNNHETPKNSQYSRSVEYNHEQNSIVIQEVIMPFNTEANIVIDEETESSNKSFHFSREFCVQFSISFTVNLLSFIYGTHIGWIGPTILKLSANNSAIPLTTSEISWLAAMLPLGGSLGPIIAAILVNTIGRKNVILLAAAPEIITWILIVCSINNYYLCIAQFIKGSIGGITVVVIPIYVGEISSPQFRGINGMIMSSMILAGIFFEIVLVPYVSLSANAWISSVVPLILLIASFWIPESPYYFLIKNQQENARKSLKVIRQNNYIDKQLEHLKRIVEEERKEVKNFTEIFRLKNNRAGGPRLHTKGPCDIGGFSEIFATIISSTTLIMNDIKK
ncbi:facilitated trehalose transporter Tret1-like [Chrysoperla carnea]|uniref:facilitated trehalose transporter Tret1-like n=1 Tax=Chrysoperla carnea TaxID=189513 RepID=UPI001D072C4D|nr:facilitated trehalose transporter Tret1-like [Chrysoperla carnea]